MRENPDDVPMYDGQVVFKGDFSESEKRKSTVAKVLSWVGGHK